MPESQYTISATISVGSKDASFATWNSSTPVSSVASVVSDDVSFNTLNVTLATTTTITGGVLTFQVSTDGVNWINVQGFQVGTGTTIGPTYALVANTYVVFSFNLTAMPFFQVLLSTAISGTGSLTIGYAADSFVNQMSSSGGSGSNPSVGPNGSPIPGDSTLIGSEDASGNLQPASASNPVPVKNYPLATIAQPATNVSISTSSVTVLAANTLRKGVNICNISYGTVSLSFGSAAVIFTGVTLGSGGTFWMDESDYTTVAINAISTQGNTLIAVQEFE